MTVEKRTPASCTLSFAGLSKPLYFEVKLQGINLVSVNPAQCLQSAIHNLPLGPVQNKFD